MPVMSLFAALALMAIIGIIRGSPDSPIGRALHLHLVEKPVRAASRIRRHHIIWIGLLSIAVLLLMAFAAGKVAAAFETTDFLFAYSFDLSLYLDAVLVASAIAATTRLRTMALLARARMRHWAGRARSGRTRLARTRARHRHRTMHRPDNDEEGPGRARPRRPHDRAPIRRCSPCTKRPRREAASRLRGRLAARIGR
jgi:hypothetical protein